MALQAKILSQNADVSTGTGPVRTELLSVFSAVGGQDLTAWVASASIVNCPVFKEGATNRLQYSKPLVNTGKGAVWLRCMSHFGFGLRLL